MPLAEQVTFIRQLILSRNLTQVIREFDLYDAMKKQDMGGSDSENQDDITISFTLDVKMAETA